MNSPAPTAEFWADRRVTVTGGSGFLGRPTVKMLESLGAIVEVPRSDRYDLTVAEAADEALAGAEIVIHLAANVGGIGYNRRHPAPLVRDNLAMGLNVFEAARKHGVERLIPVCTVCAYPKVLPVPFREEDIWNGYPEETNAPYGLAKKMLVVLSDTYRRQYGLDSSVPILANLYGPGDNFDLEDSHVIPAMIHKFVAAADGGEPEVVLWGSGEPSREFLYVEDAARGVILAAERAESSEPFNVGTGIETKIRDLAETISRATGYRGNITWDRTRPDGQPVRFLDTSRAAEMIGFESQVTLEDGIGRTVESFRETHKEPTT